MAVRFDDIRHICPCGVTFNESLAKLSHWKIGGFADVVVRPKTTQQLSLVLKYFTSLGVKPVIVGLSTNLLFSDQGLRVPMICLDSCSRELTIKGSKVEVGASYWVPSLVRKVMQAGLTGIEHACGIPGTIGGLVYMNGGSKRKSISRNIETIISLLPNGTQRIRARRDIEFSYRHSEFQTNNEVITKVILNLDFGKKDKIRSDIYNILQNRSRKFPRKLPTCGSTFVADAKLYDTHGPPGKIIENLGFKGYKIGGASVSDLHANFIVNTGNATATDVLTIIRDINRSLKIETNHTLLAEVRYVCPNGKIVPASLVADQI